MIIPHRARIGVFDLFGSIEGGKYTTSYLRLLTTLRENRRIKAVVINIDSPGGLASASNSLYLALSRLSSKKPTVAFISGAGASGAYLVSCAATKTVALPGSIVGSIGVLSIRPVLQEFLDNIGVHIAVTKSGHLKDMGAFYREMTEEEKEKEQSLLDNFYNYFVGVVVRSRHLDEAEVRKLATGEVFMAETAKELGLVDELGDFDAALDLASQLGKVPRRITYVAPRRTLLQKVFSRFTAPLIEQIWDEARGNIRERAYYLGSPHIWTRL